VIKIDSDSGAAAFLRAAASVGATQVVRALLDLGISPFLADRAHYTPLHLAAQHGHAPACKLLVEAQADPFLWDGQLISPAELAQKHGHRRCLHVFRPTPTDEDFTEEVFGSKLIQAAQIGNASRVEELLAEGIKVDESVKNKVTALHVACRGNHVLTADVLTAAGANVDACTTSGITPLILAAEESCIKVVDMLCRMRANPAAVDRHQRSPLSVAAEKGNADIVEALLDAGAPINHFNERGQTVLTVSCAFGHVEVANTLLQRKADPLLFSDVKGTNRGVDTALIAACRSNSLELVQKLLEVGVDPNHRPPITDKSGNLDPWSPLIESSANGRDAIVSELLMAKANPNMNLKGNASPLYFSACNGHLESTQLLIKHGARMDDADLSNGRNGLWWAAKEGHAEIVRYLLDVGASVNHQLHERAERAGTSPLHMAATHGHAECVSILLEKRADHTLAEMKGGNTALHLAAGGGHCEVIQFLLASGAANTCRNLAGETAAASAAAAGHEKIAAQLAHHQSALMGEVRLFMFS
jgi:ankyrin